MVSQIGPMSTNMLNLQPHPPTWSKNSPFLQLPSITCNLTMFLWTNPRPDPRHLSFYERVPAKKLIAYDQTHHHQSAVGKSSQLALATWKGFTQNCETFLFGTPSNRIGAYNTSPYPLAPASHSTTHGGNHKNITQTHTHPHPPPFPYNLPPNPYQTTPQ